MTSSSTSAPFAGSGRPGAAGTLGTRAAGSIDDPNLEDPLPDEDEDEEPDGGDGLVGLPADRPGAATRALAIWLLVAGVVGDFAAFILTWDKVKLLQNPDTHLACNINPIVGCGKVILTPQASVFGFPNSFMGLAGFSVVATIGMALLAGARFHRWFWLGLQAGVLFGIGLVCWLIDQSIFHIGALCPYCMVVWTVTIPTFLAVTAYNLRSGNLGRAPVGVGRLLTRHLGEVLVLAYAVVIALAGVHFWYYWQTRI